MSSVKSFSEVSGVSKTRSNRSGLSTRQLLSDLDRCSTGEDLVNSWSLFKSIRIINAPTLSWAIWIDTVQVKILIILDHFSKRPTNTPPNSIFEMCLFDQLRKYWESSFEWKSEILCFFLSIHSVWIALRVLRLHKLWCAADSSNSTVRTPWKFLMRIWWSPVKKLCEKWVVALSLKAQLLHPFCEMHRQVGVILLHFWKCLYREGVFFFKRSQKSSLPHILFKDSSVSFLSFF